MIKWERDWRGLERELGLAVLPGDVESLTWVRCQGGDVQLQGLAWRSCQMQGRSSRYGCVWIS